LFEEVSYPIIYHGSEYFRFYQSTSWFKPYKEFGNKGFYCTTDINLAEQYATYHTGNALEKDPRINANPIVTIYRFIDNENLITKQFKTLDSLWLDFVLECLQGQHQYYDIVAGPILNHAIYSEYLTYHWTREQLLRELIVDYKLNPAYQVCFCTPESLRTLKVMGHYTVGDTPPTI
jgi:hypothetical protein